MSRNTRRNRNRREQLMRTEAMAEDRLSIGDSIGAGKLLELAKLQGWSSPRLYDLSQRLARESKSCPCWYCGLSPEQKQKVVVDGQRKAAVLGCSYDSYDNNLIGGYAEAIFGARFRLPLNLE